jgi:hypothetical protein
VDVEGFRKKSDVMAATMDLYVANVEEAEPLAERTRNGSLTEEMVDMALRAESNPNAIACGLSVQSTRISLPEAGRATRSRDVFTVIELCQASPDRTMDSVLVLRKQVLLLMEHLNGPLDELFDTTLVATIMAEAL